MTQRTCARCGCTPNDVPFRFDKRAPDGLGAYCKPCEREYNRAYYLANKAKLNAENNARYYENRERYLAQQRTHRLANIAEYRRRERDGYWRRRPQRLAYLAAWRARQDPVDIRAYFEVWYAANRDRCRVTGKAWRVRNADRVGAYVARRLMRMRGQDGTIERIDRRAVWLRDDGVCGLCGDPVLFESMHLDHIKPLVRGGPHTFDNVQPSHQLCNLRKKDREVPRWAYATWSVTSVQRRPSAVRSPNSVSS